MSRVLDAASPLRIEGIELRLVRLELVEPFETSFGRVSSRLIVLVRMEGEGLEGWGEIVAGEQPLYSYETVGTAAARRAGLLRAGDPSGSPVHGLDDLAGRLDAFRGHPMARAGLELAFVDLLARSRGESISRVLDGSQERIPAGVSLGIQGRVEDLLERIERYVALGYRRIKLKIKPGWDVDVVAEVAAP